MGSGLVGLYLESTLAGELFTISRNWLALEKEVSMETSKYRNTKRKKKRHCCYKG